MRPSRTSPRRTARAGHRRWTTLALTAALAVPTAAVAEVAAPQEPSRVGGADDTLVVRFHPGTGHQAADDAVSSAGGQLEEAVGATGYSVVSTEGSSMEEVRQELAASGLVDRVEPNRLRRASILPSDPVYSGSQASYLGSIHLPDAWDRTTGSQGLLLAVVDSGVDLDHPDLAGRLVPGYDFVNDDSVPDDDYGHGTMVAGIAAARTNNERGVAGVTWQGSIMPIKVLDSTGTANDADIAAGITWAASHGADVINLSLGGPGASGVLQAAVDYAIARDVVVIGAAGNDGNAVPHYPAACSGVFAVGAIDANGALASFSNFGNWVDMVAPGVALSTTMLGGTERYGRGTGTSFSAPLVAGVALLLRAADPSAGQATITDRLRRSATDLGAAGVDVAYGSGVVNAAAALDLTPLTLTSASTTSPGSGYWMLGSEGRVYPFGGVPFLGDAVGALAAGTAADLEPTPSGAGYLIVDSAGHVYAFGNASYLGGVNVPLHPGEAVTSLSATPSGAGYWIFTTSGRVFAFGDAPLLGDMAGKALNGAVLDSIPTPSGKGYYMVAADGGIFAFGDARYAGSMGGERLNAPVQSLVPAPGGSGYWLVAADGGVFAFGDARFVGSMGGMRLNALVTGMVPFGNGYLMVAVDGGIFNFATDRQFAGSLGGQTLAYPIAAVAAR